MKEPAREGSAPPGADGQAATTGKPKDESIDQDPLSGCVREAFELKLHAKFRLKRPTWQLLDVLLTRYHWGKADSFPSNSGMKQWLPDWTQRTIRRHLLILREAQVIRMFEDRSIANQRRIVLVDHPHGPAVIGILTANPNVQEMIPIVHPGGTKTHNTRGDKNGAPRGDKTLSPEPLTVQPEKLNQANGNSREGDSARSPSFRESSLLGTGNGNGNAVAPLPTESPLEEVVVPQASPEVPAAIARPRGCRCRVPLDVLASGAGVRCPQCKAVKLNDQAVPQQAPAITADGSDVPAPSLPMAQPSASTIGAVSLEQVRRRAAGEAMFQPQDELEIIRLLGSLGPGSTNGETQAVALAVAMILNDRHSVRNWKMVAKYVRQGRIPLEMFVGIAGSDNPGRLATYRLKPYIDAAREANHKQAGRRRSKSAGGNP